VSPLVERAVLLNPAPAQMAARIASDAVKSLRGRAYAPPMIGVAALRLPSDQAVLERLLASAKPPDWSSEEAVMAARVVLAQPVYITPLPDGETEAPERRIRQIALVSAISVYDELWVGVGRLGVEQTTGRRPWSHDAWISVDWYSDLDAVYEALEALYLQAPSLAGIPALPRGWWIGGGKGTAAAVPTDWKTRVAAVGRVAGYDIDVIEAVGARLELPDRIANERPTCLIDWRAFTAGKPQAIVSRYRRDVPNGLYVPLDRADSFDEALSLLRLELRQRVIEPVEAQARAPDEPTTIVQAVEIAMKECLDLVFLEEALASAKKSQFPRPALVLTYLRVLNDVAKAWRAGEIDSDGFAAALTSRGVSGYRSGISDTAMGRYKTDYERSYRGEKITLGPHLASGVGAITRILRIYWWTDRRDLTFVIGHIGCKLRDASNP
jgi:hypothetical protein